MTGNLDQYYRWRLQAARLREAAFQSPHNDSAVSYRQIAESYDVLAESEALLLERSTGARPDGEPPQSRRPRKARRKIDRRRPAQRHDVIEG